MNDALVVCRLDRLSDLPGDVQRLCDRHRAAVNAFGQRLALDQLEDQAFQIAAFLQPVDGGDVGMTDGGKELGLALKPRQPIGDRKSTRLNSSHSQISYAV